jgi:hypothetical protein
MMTVKVRYLGAIGAAVALMLLAPLQAAAHNAGHLFLPTGECLNIGSFRPAPLVGKDREQLDLVPQTPNPPFDEYGASFVGFHGNTPVFAGPCR